MTEIRIKRITNSQRAIKKHLLKRASQTDFMYIQIERFWYNHFIESLILAQDERWRRA